MKAFFIFYFYFFCLMKKWVKGRLTWQSYLGMTVVTPYLPGSGPCWGAGGKVSHSFPSPMRGTNDPRLPRKATSPKSIFGLEHGTSPLVQLFVHHLTPLGHTTLVVIMKAFIVISQQTMNKCKCCKCVLSLFQN